MFFPMGVGSVLLLSGSFYEFCIVLCFHEAGFGKVLPKVFWATRGLGSCSGCSALAELLRCEPAIEKICTSMLRQSI